MGHVLATADRKYLLPNIAFVIRVKRSKAMNMFLEVFDHWKNYMSTTANSVNIEPSYSGTVHFLWGRGGWWNLGSTI